MATTGVPAQALLHCNCRALRNAARRVTHFYDERLAPTSLRTTQFTMLATLSVQGAMSINDLAQHLELDRTTMGKNILPLERMNLVAGRGSPSDARVKLLALTREGQLAYEAAYPLWEAAQAEFEQAFGKRNSAALRRMLSAVG